MKAALLSLTFVLMAMVAPAQHVSIKAENTPLENIFATVTSQTGHLFLYSNELLQESLPVTVDVEHEPLQRFLELCFRGQPLLFKIVNKTVVISRKPLQKQVDTTRRITGVVTNEEKPLENVSVTVKGTNQGTVTNSNGEFTLRNIRAGDVVAVSMVGFEEKIFSIGKPDFYTIELIVSANNLDQPVIIAYGTTTQRMNTGNVGKVGSKEIGRQPVSNPLAAIQGRVAGVYVQQSNGMPGSAFNIQIRGTNSLRTSGNHPLYIVDGVPYPAVSPASEYTSGVIAGGSSLSGINPSDISSIEVLKDADATAIYGSRGANGVVLITTKKGVEGKFQVEANASHGIGGITRKIKMMDRRQYLDMRYEAYANDARSMSTSNAPDLLLWDTTRYTDWQKELIGGRSSFSNVQVKAMGGSKQTQFVIGGGYLRESTVYPGDDHSGRISVHSNLRHSSVDNFLTLDWTTSYVQDKSNFQSVDLTRAALRLAPVAPQPYKDDGSINWENGSFIQNPFAELENRYFGQTETLVSQFKLSLRLFNHLRFTSNVGYTSTLTNEHILYPKAAKSEELATGSAVSANSQQRSWIFEPQLDYQFSFRNGKLNILTGATFQKRNFGSEAIAAAGFTSDALLENFAAAPIVSIMQNGDIRYHYSALFTRFNLQWKEQYLLNLTGRRDGSSRFGPGRQFANFGAVGAAWIFAKETNQSFKWVSFGKIRTSYGITGSDLTSDYGFFDLWRPASGSFIGVQGLYPSNLFNPNFAWETNKKFEAATELGFFENRILLSVSWYRNRSSNQLVGMPVSGVTGFTSIQSNLAATVQNTGVEIEASGSLVRTSRFSWTSGFNISFSKNRLVSFPGIESSSYASSYIVGEPLSVLRVYKGGGVDPTTGTYLIEDVNKDGMLSSPEDNTMLIITSPEYFGGWQHTINWKNFELSFLLQFVKQKAANFLQFFAPPGTRDNQPAELTDRWKKPGDISNHQLYTTTNYSNYYNDYSLSDKGFTDASFVRLKTLSLSYTFSSNFLQQSNINNLRLFIQGQNLLTFTNYKGMDPENGTFMTLPPLRIVTGGISVNF